ncbi:hypothetical protein CONCODRAFT_8786 [Conidiobolus coronatus NRRL 28638]|uniref:Secreted protein n=1 Tax=Conidiobolus coronatus (strain ATCC 28846 / CBS 209.66 / NRRL 28638) TaxID=796925 RepID=A0A137P1P7_CONC2|nr:hypothetical protein CONCODRAFT_8786 [Conidiobolus coronatus NRRL 28638]|eukprot:KXN68878.1 hypothetical protein CONCODRAFT_8786 [Conidiobolus coronatus NRRL 28638]
MLNPPFLLLGLILPSLYLSQGCDPTIPSYNIIYGDLKGGLSCHNREVGVKGCRYRPKKVPNEPINNCPYIIPESVRQGVNQNIERNLACKSSRDTLKATDRLIDEFGLNCNWVV